MKKLKTLIFLAMMLMSSTQSFPFLKGLLEGDIYFRFRREVTETPEVKYSFGMSDN